MAESNGHGAEPESKPEPKPPPWSAFKLKLRKNGEPHRNIDNLARIFEVDPTLRRIAWYDTFYQKILTGLTEGLDDVPIDPYYARQWTDADDLRITVYLQGELDLPAVSDELVRKAITFYAKITPRNEPLEWFESLTWDGHPRIDNFITDAFGAAPSLYSRAVSKNFWIGMVARIYSPGCQLDNMLVLEGAQGIGKSRALRAIGGKWYLDWAGEIDKDFYQAIQGKIVVEFSELDSFNRSEVTKIKSVITCVCDEYRAPYDVRTEQHPRQCVFVGSTNEPEWIKDQTGGRRFWPVKCNTDDLISVEYITAWRGQMFAEAVSRYKEKETWWEMPESATKEQEARRVSDIWDDLVGPWLCERPPGDKIPLAQVAEDALKADLARMNMGDQRRLGSVMRRLGWDKGTKECKRWMMVDPSRNPYRNATGNA